MTHGRYRVTGRREYRGHPPGSEFVGRIDPDAEQRAINRGDIELLCRVTPDLVPGSFTLPDDWPPGQADKTAATTEAPRGASLIERGRAK